MHTCSGCQHRRGMARYGSVGLSAYRRRSIGIPSVKDLCVLQYTIAIVSRGISLMFYAKFMSAMALTCRIFLLSTKLVRCKGERIPLELQKATP